MPWHNFSERNKKIIAESERKLSKGTFDFKVFFFKKIKNKEITPPKINPKSTEKKYFSFSKKKLKIKIKIGSPKPISFSFEKKAIRKKGKEKRIPSKKEEVKFPLKAQKRRPKRKPKRKIKSGTSRKRRSAKKT